VTDGPLLDCHFVVAFDDAPIAFASVVLPRIGTPAEEPRPSLVLRRNATGALDLYLWCDDERRDPGRHDRKVTVTVLNGDHEPTPLAWTFDQCRPLGLTVSPLDALSGAALMETIEIGYASVRIGPVRRRPPVRRPVTRPA
jgi:hypothetical protein